VLSELEGVIAQRVLLNFRADPNVVAPLIPPPFDLIEQNGYALVGVCLIRFAGLRPAGWPRFLGWSPRSMAHRAAVRFRGRDGAGEGVYIFRRDTSNRTVALFGGRLFPGRQSRAIFEVQDSNSDIEISVHTDEADADVRFRAAKTLPWTTSSKLFSSLQTATGFLARGECGFSPSASDGCLDGMRLRINDWRASPLAVEHIRAAFFENPRLFPPGSIDFDHALLMENVPHRWLRIDSPVDGAAESNPTRSSGGTARVRPFVRFFGV